jgi:hypothetical protein
MLTDTIPGWENDQSRMVEVVEQLSDKTFVCEDTDYHPNGVRVRMFEHSQCEQCAGGDDFGTDFCPLCDYCCGC